MNDDHNALLFEVIELKNEVEELRRSIERMRIIPGAGVVVSESEGGTVVELDSAEVFLHEYTEDFAVRVELDGNGDKLVVVRHVGIPNMAGLVATVNHLITVPVRTFEPRDTVLYLRVTVDEQGELQGTVINSEERESVIHDPLKTDFTTIAQVKILDGGEISIYQMWRNGTRYLDYRWWV